MLTKEECNEIFESVKLAPLVFNRHHTNYLTVIDQETKEKLKKAANGQYKVSSSSSAVILGDKNAFLQAPEINEGLKVLT
jgi:putative NAD(P)H nitroreductase